MMSLIPRGSRKSTGGDLSLLSELRSEMNRVFDNFVREPFGNMAESFGWGGQLGPSVDISETDKEITLLAELPGVDPKDLDITVTADRITISGEKRETVEKTDKNYHQKEIRAGKFSRSFSLPSGVDTQQINAEHKNGVLTVRLAKSQTHPGRKVEVKAG
jgi:HSP20 family protein